MTSRLAVPVYYDFASTISYVAHRVMAGLAPDLDALGIDLVWRPIDLVLITRWPRGAVVEGPRRDNALRVAEELGVVVRMPGEWIDSRPAASIALALAATAKEAAWRERVWSAVFEEGEDIGRADALERLAGDLGIDVSAGDAAGARLEALTIAAREAEVTGVPTFDLGFPLGGIQQPATMLHMLRRWADKRRSARR